MQARGVVRKPIALSERVDVAIASLADSSFTEGQIVTAIGGHRSSIRDLLAKGVHKGVLERITPGTYRHLRGQLTSNLPPGLITSAVFQILFTDPEHRLWSLPDMTGEVQSLVSRNDIGMSDAISHVFTYWHKSGYLEREGKRNSYRFRLLAHVTEQPVLTQSAVI